MHCPCQAFTLTFLSRGAFQRTAEVKEKAQRALGGAGMCTQDFAFEEKKRKPCTYEQLCMRVPEDCDEITMTEGMDVNWDLNRPLLYSPFSRRF